MEPLTGFFILEGLLFEVIVIILIVRDISPFHYSYSKEIIKRVKKHTEIMNERHEKPKPSLINFDDYDSLKSPVTWFDFTEFYKEFQQFKIKITEESIWNMGVVITRFDYEIDKEMKKNNHIQRSALPKLSFLVGALLLQGIGIINQLFQ